MPVEKNITNIDFSETGNIGDTIGGLMNPFVALAGVLVTFLAFYIQYLTNKNQTYLFEKQIVEQKKQFNTQIQDQK